MEQLLRVGVITTTHGIRGEVKVFPTTDDIHRFDDLEEVILQNKKDIEAHFYFPCASISFLSVPGRTDHLAYILWYIFTWQ